VAVSFGERQSAPGNSCNNTITRTWIASDTCGNTASYSQTITVSDTTAPVLTCPPDKTVDEYSSTDPSATGWATASDNCDPSPTIIYSDVTSGGASTVITRTWVATDCAGNHTTCVQTIALVDPPVEQGTLITDSMRWTLPNNQLRLAFTPDSQNLPCYKLTASNPGQFYYNVFYSATPGSSVTFRVTLPYPWVTQGAKPVEVYDGVAVKTSGGQTCLVPGNKILAGSQQVTLSSYVAKPVMGVTTCALSVTVTVPPTGFVFLAIHLDYGLKANPGYGQDAAGDATLCASTGTILIPNNESYTFSVSGAASGSATVSSSNAFKKNPVVGGSTQSQIATFSVPGAVVQLKDAKGIVLAAGVSDQDGWCLLNYKANSKAAICYVTVTPPAGYGTAQTKSITLKANSYLEVDFTTK